jgi:hypothetical protein
MNRRRFLLLMLIVLLGLDFGIGRVAGLSSRPAGWKMERWEAGFGSWARGGYGVAYTVAMPPNYHFAEKCGTAWITREDQPDDFSIRLTFAPAPGGPTADVQDYFRNDAPHSAGAWDTTLAGLVRGAPVSERIGGLAFTRTDLTLNNADLRGDDSAPAHRGPVYGATYTGDRVSAIADFDLPDRFVTHEKIVRTLRPARGIGIIDLLLGAATLFGC